MENNKRKSKKYITVIALIIIIAILLIPNPRFLNDGGTVEYKALLYNVTKLHKISDYSPTGYDMGTKIEILGIEVYNDIIINEPPDEEYRIDKKINDGWKEVNRVDGNFAFKDLAWIVGDDNAITNNVNWESLYGKLEPGQYRMVKKVDGKMFSGIQVEFEIK